MGKEEESCDSADQFPTAILQPCLAREDKHVLKSMQDRYYDILFSFIQEIKLLTKLDCANNLVTQNPPFT